jgi:molybdate transport system substrate-binding protein
MIVRAERHRLQAVGNFGSSTQGSDKCAELLEEVALIMRNILLALFVATMLTSTANAEDLTVAAASDLSYALKDLSAGFEKATGNKVVLSFGASGNLFSQIKSGAPFDLFFSADADYPKQLAAEGLVDGDSIRIYAIGHLVLWVPNSLKLDLQTLKMDLLTQPQVRRVAIANPQHAPYGRAAIAAINHSGLKEKVADKLVFGENISQAAQFVQSGNAQAGLIALSLALSPNMKDAGKFWELPSDSYPELRQAVGVVSASKQKAAAKAFSDYVTSAEGRAILERYGFRAPVSE